jgi:hypothetical protein
MGGLNLVHVAAIYIKNPSILQLFLDYGADYNAIDLKHQSFAGTSQIEEF